MYGYLAEAVAQSRVRELDLEASRPDALMTYEMKLGRPARRRRRWRGR